MKEVRNRIRTTGAIRAEGGSKSSGPVSTILWDSESRRCFFHNFYEWKAIDALTLDEPTDWTPKDPAMNFVKKLDPSADGVIFTRADYVYTVKFDRQSGVVLGKFGITGKDLSFLGNAVHSVSSFDTSRLRGLYAALLTWYPAANPKLLQTLLYKTLIKEGFSPYAARVIVGKEPKQKLFNVELGYIELMAVAGTAAEELEKFMTLHYELYLFPDGYECHHRRSKAGLPEWTYYKERH